MRVDGAVRCERKASAPVDRRVVVRACVCACVLACVMGSNTVSEHTREKHTRHGLTRSGWCHRTRTSEHIGPAPQRLVVSSRHWRVTRSPRFHAAKRGAIGEARRVRERWGADEVSVAVEDGYMVQEWARLGYDRQRTRYVRWRWTLEEDGERRQRRRSRERQVFIIIVYSRNLRKWI